MLAGPGAARRDRCSRRSSSYDHPQLAPESPADLFDATEIDEILTLRTLTLTDEEKAEARATDPRAAAIIDRGRRDAAGDAGAPARRDPLTCGRPRRPGRPAPDRRRRSSRPTCRGGIPAPTPPSIPETDAVLVGGHAGRQGQPGAAAARPRRADAQDLFLAACTATVAGGAARRRRRRHVAVTLDDDPAADLQVAHGRFRYFRPDEIEVPREPRAPRKGILVAGVGNIFLGDDGFGVEVARRLAGRDLPDGVEVADFGIRGMHLAYDLLDGYDALVLVDAVRAAATARHALRCSNTTWTAAADEAARFDAHGMEPGAVLSMLDQLAHGVGVERPVDRVLRRRAASPRPSTRGSDCPNRWPRPSTGRCRRSSTWSATCSMRRITDASSCCWWPRLVVGGGGGRQPDA